MLINHFDIPSAQWHGETYVVWSALPVEFGKILLDSVVWKAAELVQFCVVPLQKMIIQGLFLQQESQSWGGKLHILIITHKLGQLHMIFNAQQRHNYCNHLI